MTAGDLEVSTPSAVTDRRYSRMLLRKIIFGQSHPGFMSDTEIILQLLRRVEWRLRTARLLHDFMLAVSIVLAMAVPLRAWDLFSSAGSTTTAVFSAACVGILIGYFVWRLRETVPLEHA